MYLAGAHALAVWTSLLEGRPLRGPYMAVDRFHSMDKVLRELKGFKHTMLHEKEQTNALVCVQRCVHWAGFSQPDTRGASSRALACVASLGVRRRRREAGVVAEAIATPDSSPRLA